MNRGYLYLLLAALSLLGVWALDSWWWRVPLLWTGLSGAFFGVGYLTGYGELLRKNSAGRVPGWIKLVLLPVFVGITVYHLIARRLDPAPPMQKIREGLWLGRRLTVADRALFEESAVTAVLDVTAEFDAPGVALLPDQINYFNIPVFDRTRPRLSQLVKAVKWISRQRADGREVLIHCALGQGRSVTALLGYLLFENPEADPEVLLQEIQETRATAAPNKPQMRLLQRFKESEAIRDKPRTRVIFNPVSGNRDAEKDETAIREALAPFLQLEIVKTTPETSARELAEAALSEGVDQIVAAGGDGTVGEVAAVLAGTGVPLGIVPRGTANALAVCLYGASIRLDPITPCAHHILSGLTREIDMGRCNGEPMLQLAGFGVEAGMVERADRELKNKYGALAYLMGGWQQIADQELFEVELTIDGEIHHLRAGSLTVANAAPMASVFAQGGPGPQMDDGLLDVTAIVDVESKADALEIMHRLLVGEDSGEAPGAKVKHFRGRRIRVVATPEQTMVVDGEVTGSTPAEFTIEAGALKMLVDTEMVRPTAAGEEGPDEAGGPAG